jgi:hypothetical protein
VTPAPGEQTAPWPGVETGAALWTGEHLLRRDLWCGSSGPILKPCLCPPLQEIARKRVLIISEPSSSPRASFASNTPAGMPDAANTPGLWPGLVSERLSSTQHVTVADCIAQKQPVRATVAHGP